MKKRFQIVGMKCQGCADKVAAAIKSVPGVSDVKVDFEKGWADVEGGDFNSRAILSCLKGTPYKIEELYHENPYSFFSGRKRSEGE